MQLADLELPEQDIKALNQVYRMVGKRDYGLDFCAIAIPVVAMLSLLDSFIEYLRETAASADEITNHTRLLEELMEANA